MAKKRAALITAAMVTAGVAAYTLIGGTGDTPDNTATTSETSASKNVDHMDHMGVLMPGEVNELTIISDYMRSYKESFMQDVKNFVRENPDKDKTEFWTVIENQINELDISDNRRQDFIPQAKNFFDHNIQRIMFSTQTGVAPDDIKTN
jgi:hypothetical protein